MPAINAPSENDSSLVRGRLMPIASAATSSSCTAIIARPNLTCRMRQTTSTPQRAATTLPQLRERADAAHSGRAAGRLEIEEEHTDDLAETER